MPEKDILVNAALSPKMVRITLEKMGYIEPIISCFEHDCQEAGSHNVALCEPGGKVVMIDS